MRTRIRAGDPSAFAELFDDYARSVYNHAFRLTADWAAAEDVMATTFMEAWRLRDRVDPEGGTLRLWLLGIATNTARNQTRGNRRYRRAATAAARAEMSVPDHAEEVAGRVDDRRRLAAALTALAALRRPEREVLTLCLWEGLEYTAAAEVLGIPVGTVRSRLSRARARLRRLTDAELTAAAPPASSGRTPSGRASTPVASAATHREPVAGPGQVRGDRRTAVRPAQEGIR
ncbi:RNA polymerase sigma factor [Streptomyces sp. NPDC002476]|uniref:RNA polymerase sigma factor n=1 Tax=Streptomyces sp. NPDC002476 TaxID=3364648 RepID=UPI0036899AC5